MKKLLQVLKGFLTDFWMLPLAVFLAISHSVAVANMNWMPTLNEVKIGNIVPTLVVFLLIMAIARAYFYFQYPDVYHKSLMNKKNETWKKLSPFQQFLFLRLERWVLILAAVLIYLAMF
ncbi:MAG: hypothetical protein JXR54_10010 [Tannerellaceae bacterium]|nr:hypothetical protein [Tannerellaceae bacterium]